MKYFNLILILILAPSSIALPYFSQILYSPIKTDYGGEAIEIKSDVAMDLSFWYISTSKNEKDFIFPNGSRIEVGGAILIADRNWSNLKDNALWREADFENAITLANTNGYVALYDGNGNLIDLVGWGKAEKFLEEPALPTKKGYSLIRVGFMGNNRLDYIEGEPAFFETEIALVFENEKFFEARIEGDASVNEGVQLFPGQKFNLSGFVSRSSIVKFFESNLAIDPGDFKFELEVPNKKPGLYKIEFVIKDLNSSEILEFEILPIKKIIVPEKVLKFERKGDSYLAKLEIKNTGNVDLNLKIFTTNLIGPSEIEAAKIFYRFEGKEGNFEKELVLNLISDSKAEIVLFIKNKNFKFGKYVGQIIIETI